MPLARGLVLQPDPPDINEPDDTEPDWEDRFESRRAHIRAQLDVAIKRCVAGEAMTAVPAVGRAAERCGIEPRVGAEPPLASDTVTFVVPGMRSVDAFKGTKPAVKVYVGADGNKRAREEFFAAIGSKDPKSELAYVRVAPVLIWRDWALVAVVRPRDRAGVEIGSGSNGGATYMLHRVEGEWRLLSIVRTWGF